MSALADRLTGAPFLRHPRARMQRRAGIGSHDALAIAALFGTALVIAWPILNGGYLTYVDNPVHLAEIAALAAHPVGWSELGFLGFPLRTLHSPLWYPALAAVARAGVNVERIYAGLLVLGFAAPSLAVYAVACRRTHPIAAFGIAYLVLIQAPLIRGIGSPLAGMWTHGLGAAGVVLLAGVLSRPRLSFAGHLTVAVLLALTALTHLFALVAGALVVCVTCALHFWNRDLTPRELGLRALDCAIAALASSGYWVTFLLTTRPELAPQQVLGPFELLASLLLPTDVLHLLEHDVRSAVRHDLLLTDSLPLILLLVAGVAGFVHRSARPNVLSRTGFLMAVVVLGALIVHPFRPIAALGPVSFRHTVWIELGAALSAIGWVAPRQFELHPRLAAGLPFALALTGLWWGKPLRDDRPAATAEEWRELESLWRFIGQNADREAGRVYLQDTFGQGWQNGGLAHSHVLVLCQTRTHLPQLGTYYGVVPYATRWTLSEFQRLYDRYTLTANDLDLRLKRTNVQLIVTSTKETARLLARTRLLDRVHRVGRYSVWRPKRVGGWVSPLDVGTEVSDVVWDVGRISFAVSSSVNPRVLVKTSFHPWWNVEGARVAEIGETEDGLIALAVGRPGRHRITLRYTPLRWPGLLGSAGWVILLAWGVAALARRDWWNREQATESRN
jgi:hypothetical protein